VAGQRVIPTMVLCDATHHPADLILIRNTLNGRSPWNGSDNSNVNIAINGVGCLTNPVTVAGLNPVGPLWSPCVNSTSTYEESIATARQVWQLQKLPSGALSISSNMEQLLGFPGAQLLCLERINPTDLRLTPCNGLHNWMDVPVTP
jgi:hypothetical protein